MYSCKISSFKLMFCGTSTEGYFNAGSTSEGRLSARGYGAISVSRGSSLRVLLSHSILDPEGYCLVIVSFAYKYTCTKGHVQHRALKSSRDSMQGVRRCVLTWVEGHLIRTGIPAHLQTKSPETKRLRWQLLKRKLNQMSAEGNMSQTFEEPPVLLTDEALAHFIQREGAAQIHVILARLRLGLGQAAPDLQRIGIDIGIVTYL
eukprot:335577-Pyramimonas_sp.AAC.1